MTFQNFNLDRNVRNQNNFLFVIVNLSSMFFLCFKTFLFIFFFLSYLKKILKKNINKNIRRVNSITNIFSLIHTKYIFILNFNLILNFQKVIFLFLNLLIKREASFNTISFFFIYKMSSFLLFISFGIYKYENLFINFFSFCKFHNFIII